MVARIRFPSDQAQAKALRRLAFSMNSDQTSVLDSASFTCIACGILPLHGAVFLVRHYTTIMNNKWPYGRSGEKSQCVNLKLPVGALLRLALQRRQLPVLPCVGALLDPTAYHLLLRQRLFGQGPLTFRNFDSCFTAYGSRTATTQDSLGSMSVHLLSSSM